MVRSILMATGVLAVISAGALADPVSNSGTTKIIRTNPDGTARQTVIHRHLDRYGNLVTHKKTIHEGMSGTTITHSRKTVNPAAGGDNSTTVVRKTIER